MLKTGILMCSLTLVTATPSNAQEVTKPRTTTTTDRPPPPATMTAKQQPDGTIRVTWSSVDGTGIPSGQRH